MLVHLFWFKGATSQVAGSCSWPNCHRSPLNCHRSPPNCHRSWPNYHCSRPKCHSNLRRLLIKFPSARRWVRPSLVTSRCETHQRTGPPNSLHSQWCRYVNKTLPRAGLFPGAQSCAFKCTDIRHVSNVKHLISSRLCPSTAGCSPPSMSSIFVCLLPS